MSYAELERKHQEHKLNDNSLKFYYAVNRRAASMSLEQAFQQQKQIALDGRFRQEQLQQSLATSTGPILPQVSSTSPSTQSQADIRRCCRNVMEVLRFDPPGHISLTDPRLVLMLPEHVRRMWLEDELTASQVQVLLQFDNPDVQLHLAELARDRGLSPHDMHELIAKQYAYVPRLSCPSSDSRALCHRILELWCRGLILSDHVRLLLCEIMSTRLIEEMGYDDYRKQRRTDAKENRCFLSRTFAQGSFVPAFYDAEQYQINPPLSSADSIFHLLWLHRKDGVAVLDHVVRIVLDLDGKSEATWLVTLIALRTRTMTIVATTNAFQNYFEDLKVQLEEQIQELNAKYEVIITPSKDTSTIESDDEEEDKIGCELRGLVAELDELNEYQTTVEMHEAALRCAEEEKKRQEELQRQEDEVKEMLKSFRYSMFVSEAVEKKRDQIRADVTAGYEEDIRKEVEKRMKRTKRKTVVEWKKTLDEDHAHWLIRRTRQKERLERRERLAHREDVEDGATRRQQRQKRREKARLKRHRLSTDDESARPAIGDHIPLLLSADEWA